MAKTNLIYLENLIYPKEKLFYLLKKEKRFNNCFRLYTKSIHLRTDRMGTRILICRNLLEKAENVHNSFAETALTTYSIRLNKMMSIFSAVGVAYMPLGLVPQFWGMNVEVP